MTSRSSHFACALSVMLAMMSYLCGTAHAGDPGVRATRFGTSTFPFGPSPAAVERTYQIANELSDVYVVQLDNGVPWVEAMNDARFPVAVERKWREFAGHSPPGRPVYLALAPLAEDRVSLAPAGDGSARSEKFSKVSFDDPSVVKAYTIYARRAVRYFGPTFLNLGLESGELAHRKPGEWKAFVGLIKAVMASLRQEFPSLKMGISFGLQSLMDAATAERARQIVDVSDYVGISFYPYMSSFHEKFGLRALPPAPDQWRAPLDWLRSFSTKPIAITETGYNTQDVALPKWKLQMKGSSAAQSQYVSDLASVAKRDGYWFVIYYLPVDIGPLIESLPESAGELASMWRDNGLLDVNAKPKPALDVWKSLLAAKYEAPPTLLQSSATLGVDAKAPLESSARETSGVAWFNREANLCESPSPARVSLVGGGKDLSAMQWEFPAGTRKWTWCALQSPDGLKSAKDEMRFRIRSDVEGRVFLQMKTAANGSYYVMVQAERDWRDVNLRWSDFRPEPGKNSAGGLDPKTITSVVFADEGDSTAAADGVRRIWIRDWSIK